LSEEDFSKRLQRIEKKIDFLLRMLEDLLSIRRGVDLKPTPVDTNSKASVKVYLLRLPDSLRRTMLVMERLGEATTVDVARETGRSRSVESIHLNQLERMGYLEKYRKGRKIYFKVSRPLIKGAETDSRRRSNEFS